MSSGRLRGSPPEGERSSRSSGHLGDSAQGEANAGVVILIKPLQLEVTGASTREGRRGSASTRLGPPGESHLTKMALYFANHSSTWLTRPSLCESLCHLAIGLH